jgi:dihydroflavonol-4-reductase
MASQILITGATGFIGRQLTLDLASAGHAVRVLARSPQKARALFSDAVEVIVGDLRDASSLKPACAGIETVYHVAGVYRFGVRHRREIRQTNIEGTENLLAAAAAAQVAKIVHVSSASVLGRPKNPSDPWPILNETDFPSSPPRLSPYKCSKWEAERRVLAWAGRGLPVVIVNPSCPIGAGDETPTPTGLIIRDFIRGRFTCYCQVGLNFVNVSDVSAGLQQAARSGRVGERYLLTNQNLWLKEFLDELADQTGLPAPRFCLPHGLVQAMSCFGEAFDLLNPRSPSARLCLETALQARHAHFFDHAKARRELGWSPSSIQSGIRQALAWFQREPLPESACGPLPAAKSHVR